ncbi:FeoB-associated Cys-rich membrane protein [uncultured Cetobacterium sp.]|nr:FeoB-associated Cys-rich membrane protein [uncultured Cetobacterium sp.]
MKNLILVAIVVVIAIVGLKSLYKMLRGKGGCSCSKDKQGSCSFKDKCKH